MRDGRIRARHTEQPAPASRRGIPRSAVRVPSGWRVAVHASNQHDGEVGRHTGRLALPPRLSADTAGGHRPSYGAWIIVEG